MRPPATKLSGPPCAAFPVEGPAAYFRSGWSGVMPSCVQEAVKGLWDKPNRMDPDGLDYKTNGFWWEALSQAKGRLAAHVNAAPDEVIFTRNTTEAVNTVLLGLDLEPGDEVVTSEGDYSHFIGAFQQREARDGIVLKTVPLPAPAEEPAAVVAAFEAAITPRTRALLCCHVYKTGQITPVRALCEMAHARGVRVIVDAALAFGHVATDLRAMDCDYYGASFHKFAGGPRGTGFLFVKKEHIEALWPSCGSLSWRTRKSNHAISSIGKLVVHGTDTIFLFAAIPTMLDLHEAIGPERRQARLFHLTRSWTDRVKGLPGVRFAARVAPEHVCGLVGMTLGDVRPRDLTLHLLKRREFLLPHPSPEFNWVNVNVFTAPSELDRLVEELRTIGREGLPA
jgi:isopenicillin-N epimerase